ncbi:hypothetical protein [Curvibacter lanceolatus]|uniref:hypothetical protein n=1 Tax=Curvibacter lanceolatus TaxID=86182 RepID=UPI00036086E0|nr:hypothetical protein [Curvibacter lanceolatus]
MTNAAPVPKPKKPTPPAAGPAPEAPEPRTIEEAYTAAIVSSHLRVEADRPGAADFLIAAGWSQSRIGLAMLRLHTEWERAAKPRPVSKEAVERIAKEVPRTVKVAPPHPATQQARAQAEVDRWEANEWILVIQQLKSWKGVAAILTGQMDKWKVHDPSAKASKVILWWMNQNCPACNGTKLGPSGRGAMCRPCKGTGKTQPPFGEDGKRLANWIDCCVELARGNIGQRRSGGKR